jgi:hypothetical protein
MRTMGEPAGKRKFKIYQEDVKLRHTSHWDADYMSREEFEAYMEGKTVCQVKKRDARAHTREDAAASDESAPSLWERFLRACLPRR